MADPTFEYLVSQCRTEPMSAWGATSEDHIIVFVNKPIEGTIVGARKRRRWWEFWRA